MLDNVKIWLKVSAGSGILLVLLLVIGAVSYHSLGDAQDAFTSYRHIARQNNALGRIQASMLEVRIHAKDFLIKGSDEASNAVKDRAAIVERQIGESRSLFDDPTVLAAMDGVAKEIASYQETFQKTHDLQQQRAALHQTLDDIGPGMEKAITGLMQRAHDDGHGDAAYLAGKVLHATLSGRLFASKYIASHADPEAEQTGKEIAAALTDTERLAALFTDEESQGGCRTLVTNLKRYAETFDKLRAATFERDGLVATVLDRIGAKVDQDTENLKQANIKLQDELGPRADSEIRQGIIIAITIALLAIGLGIAIAVGMTHLISRPIIDITRAMSLLAGGKTGAVVPGLGRHDEIGEMAKAVQVFKESLIESDRMREREYEKQRHDEEKMQRIAALCGGFDSSARTIVATVSSSSQQLQGTAQSMSAKAEQTNRQCTTVAAAAEQASANVQTVASATEELAASIGEISRQVSESTRIAGAAVEEANRTNGTVAGLQEAAQKIGEVVKLINDIASQTNLLALNATIEAARAGDAGKGFAVVASEVKNLANQTAKATEDIQAQVAQMQSVTGTTVDAIRSISSTIRRISEISTTIAAAVEEQGAATKEISRNVQEASRGTAEVSGNIQDVLGATRGTGQDAQQTLRAANDLSKAADKLSREVEQFIREIKGS